jgi:hypothetical protein
MDFEFVDQLNQKFRPLAIEFSLDHRDNYYYLVATNKKLNSEFFQTAEMTVAEFLEMYVRSFFTHKKIQVIDDNTVEFEIGSVFDILKEAGSDE